MNIFYLDCDPQRCATYHCDKHVTKMVIETAQLLSTAVRKLPDIKPEGVYKMTHENHPCAIWVRQNREQYDWTLRLLKALGREYEHRYGKQHKTIREVVPHLDRYLNMFQPGEFTPPPQVMPDEHKHENPVIAYRSYYHDKRSFARYTKRDWPHWLQEV